MKKILIFLVVCMAIYADNIDERRARAQDIIKAFDGEGTNAEKNPRTVCENNGGFWYWNDKIIQAQCSHDKKLNQRLIREREQNKQAQQQEIARQKQIDLQNEQARLRDQLLKENNYAKAYQTGLIDKDTARTEMLKRGQIIEAFEAKLIDKDTADLYLKKQAMDNATRASQQQIKVSQDQAASARRAADAAEDAEFNQRNPLRRYY